MSNIKDSVSVAEFSKLLKELVDNRPDICIRYRLLGKMWADNFTRIIRTAENEVLLNDEVQNKLIKIQQLSQILQFEIDHSFKNFSAHFHYTIKTLNSIGGIPTPFLTF